MIKSGSGSSPVLGFVIGSFECLGYLKKSVRYYHHEC